jgi:hypothetical protein
VLDSEALKTACFLLAKNTKWERRPVGVHSIKRLANQFFEIAKDYEEFVSGQERDPNLITRAVLYLSNVHAVPTMQENTVWFSSMMDVLIELACPNTQSPLETEAFYKDIEEGISESRNGFRELIEA